MCWPGGRKEAEWKPSHALCLVGQQPRLGCSCGIWLPPPSAQPLEKSLGNALSPPLSFGPREGRALRKRALWQSNTPHWLSSSFQLSNKETSLDVALKPSPVAGEKQEGTAPPLLPRGPGWASPACEAGREASLEALRSAGEVSQPKIVQHKSH